IDRLAIERGSSRFAVMDLAITGFKEELPFFETDKRSRIVFIGSKKRDAIPAVWKCLTLELSDFVLRDSSKPVRYFRTFFKNFDQSRITGRRSACFELGIFDHRDELFFGLIAFPCFVFHEGVGRIPASRRRKLKRLSRITPSCERKKERDAAEYRKRPGSFASQGFFHRKSDQLADPETPHSL